VPGGVDGALDAANVAVAAMDAVRHGGAFVSLLNTAPQARRAITTTNLAYHCDGPRLAELSALAGAGRLTLRVSRTLPFEEAGTAQDELTKGGVRGQLVLVP
jgi:NADPH:quinone reductase-like Zn-dependent oxidoreductase